MDIPNSQNTFQTQKKKMVLADVPSCSELPIRDILQVTALIDHPVV